ncbi:MAG: hypothetical protein ABIN36_18875, partial [Ferruginibacter sp.]
KTTLSYQDMVLFSEKTDKPVDDFDPSSFFLTDKNIRGIKLDGKIDYNASMIHPGISEQWNPELVLPVQAFGNVVKATRGETVKKEILGSGNATIINQTFKLKKKPLTYFAAPTAADDQGIKNSLRIYVDGIRWTEVSTFFNKTDQEEIYIVRQDDSGDSFATFGDGIRGRRLPSGTDNIVAEYRFGAEAAAAPAGSITQISKPVKDFSAINNPLPASGGEDAEPAEELRSSAPKSILTLGRIVSIQDIEAVAIRIGGVQAVQVDWRWHATKLSPLIHVWYIGDEGIQEAMNKRLRSLSDPSVIIEVEQAAEIPSTLKMDIQVDAKYIIEDVLKAVRIAFMNKHTGILTPENIGIGKPLFRSKIFSTALTVPGVRAVKSIFFNEEIFSAFAKTAGAGRYFDFEKGNLQLTPND